MLQSTDGKTGHGNSRPAVSVIIPARDAEALLARALESVHAQDYGGPLEVILADGSETPRDAAAHQAAIPTGAGGRQPRAYHPGRAEPRPADRPVCGHRTLRRAGRAAAKLSHAGGGHAAAHRGGERGGRLVPVGCTPFERAVALATSTPLAAGDARYRIGGAEGPVDTVFPGVFRYEALQAVGGFDETLLRNEDYELNWRLRERGETVWFDPRLILEYRPRGSLRALARQYFEYGTLEAVMLARHPRSWRLRQLAAPALLALLAASALLAAAAGVTAAGGLPAAVPLAYALFLLGGSAVIGVRRRRIEAALVPVVAATIHVCWGLGFFVGVAAVARARAR